MEGGVHGGGWEKTEVCINEDRQKRRDESVNYLSLQRSSIAVSWKTNIVSKSPWYIKGKEKGDNTMGIMVRKE